MTDGPRHHRARPRLLRGAAVGLTVVALVSAVALLWKPSRVTLQTVVLIPSLVGAGPQPLALFSAAPRRETLPYRSDPSLPDRADLWLPAGATATNRAGALVLVLGVNNVGRGYPAVVRFADAMARSGVAVLVPDSAGLLAGNLDPSEVDGVVDAVQLLLGRPEIDPGRIGLVGLSVGGSLALLAAADPRIASRVRWVNAFGAYADAAEYLAEVATHEAPVDGVTMRWEPVQLTRETFIHLVLGLVPAADDRGTLADACQAAVTEGRVPAADPAVAARLTTDAGRTIYGLLTVGKLSQARALLARLPDAVRALLARLSPAGHLGAIQAQVFVMADSADAYVPPSQSVELAADLSSIGRLARFTEFRLFEHVEPKGVDLVAAAPELWKLLWHVQAVLLETL